LGAVILRRDHSVFPPLTHYLVGVKAATLVEEKDWSQDKDAAHLFDDHGKAERLAKGLREVVVGEHLYFHASVREKPMPLRPVPDPRPRPVVNEPEHIRLDHFRERQCRRDPVEADQ
jgi:hypothetical protein